MAASAGREGPEPPAEPVLATSPVLDYEGSNEEALQEEPPKPPRVLPENPTHDECVKYIQRKWKSRKFRKMFANFPSLEQLRSIYLDPKAEAAGAAGSKWYTSLALAAREHVRMSDEVKLCVNQAWVAINQAAMKWAEDRAREVGAANNLPDAEVDTLVAAARKELEVGITREAYMVMSQKLYLMSKAGDGEVDIDAADVLETAQEDWDADTGGLMHLTEEAFTRCWFQLIDVSVPVRALPLPLQGPSRMPTRQLDFIPSDACSDLGRLAWPPLRCFPLRCLQLHTESLDATEYAAWGDATLNTITEVHPDTGLRVWRGDRDLVRVAFEKAGGGRSAAEQRAFDRNMQSSLRRWPSALPSAAAGGGADAVASAARHMLAGTHRTKAAEAKMVAVQAARRERAAGKAGIVVRHRGPGFYAGGAAPLASYGSGANVKTPNEWVEPMRQITRGGSAGSARSSSPPSEASSRPQSAKRPASAAALLGVASRAQQFINVIARDSALSSRRGAGLPPKRSPYPLRDKCPRLGLAEAMTVYEGSNPLPAGLGRLRPRPAPISLLRHYSEDPSAVASTLGAEVARKRAHRRAAAAAHRARHSPHALAQTPWKFNTPLAQLAFGSSAATRRPASAGAVQKQEARRLYYANDFSQAPAWRHPSLLLRPAAELAEAEQLQMEAVLGTAVGAGPTSERMIEQPPEERPGSGCCRGGAQSYAGGWAAEVRRGDGGVGPASAPGGTSSRRTYASPSYLSGGALGHVSPWTGGAEPPHLPPPPPPPHSPAVSRPGSANAGSRPGSAKATRSIPSRPGSASRSIPSRPGSASSSGSSRTPRQRETARSSDEGEFNGGRDDTAGATDKLDAIEEQEASAPGPAAGATLTPSHEPPSLEPLALHLSDPASPSSSLAHPDSGSGILSQGYDASAWEAELLRAVYDTADAAASSPLPAEASVARKLGGLPMAAISSPYGLQQMDQHMEGLGGGTAQVSRRGQPLRAPPPLRASKSTDFLALALAHSSSTQALVRAAVGSPFPPVASMSKLARLRHGSALASHDARPFHA